MKPRKILAIKLRSMGDTVIFSASIKALATAFPHAKIHVLVTDTWAPLLENNPQIHQIWHYQKKERPAARARIISRLALKLRQEKFDLAINFHASPSSAILSFATGAKERAIHFHGHQHRNRYSTVTIPNKGKVQPIIERDLDAIRALKVKVATGILPEILVSDQEIEQTQSYLQHYHLNTPLLGLGLGASRPTKIWPLERFAELAIRWCQQTGGSAIAMVGPQEEKLVENFQEEVEEKLKQSDPRSQFIRKKITHVIDFPLRKSAALLQACAGFVGNDSGPRHLAVSVGTPTVTLIGPEHPYEWHPYPVEHHPYLYIDHLPCRKAADPQQPPWCSLVVCIEENHKCLKKISVDQVFDTLMKVKR